MADTKQTLVSTHTKPVAAAAHFEHFVFHTSEKSISLWFNLGKVEDNKVFSGSDSDKKLLMDVVMTSIMTEVGKLK